MFSGERKVDSSRIGVESALSFRRSMFDERLVSACDHVKVLDKMNEFLFLSAAREEFKMILLKEEVSLLYDYIELVQEAFDIVIQVTENIEDEDLMLQPFILFPLIQNAVHYGYNTMDRYPLKMKLTVLGGTCQLEVSNRVNHYLDNQGGTSLIELFKQRLLHLYPESHSLILNSNSNTFKVTLVLKLL